MDSSSWDDFRSHAGDATLAKDGAATGTQESTGKACWTGGPASGRGPIGQVEEVDRARRISAHRWRLTEERKAKERACTDKQEKIWSGGEGPPVLPRPVTKHTYISSGGRTDKQEIDDHGKAPARSADKVKAKARPSILELVTAK
jgi:hypothetical protein